MVLVVRQIEKAEGFKMTEISWYSSAGNKHKIQTL